MALFTDKLAFYWCPCTGGSWVKSVFLSLGMKTRFEGHGHGTPAENPPHKVISFTVRRDLQDWLNSWSKISPPYAWPAPSWLVDAKTVDDAKAVFAHYSEGVDYVLELDDLRNGLQRVFDAAGIDKQVPDIPKVGHHAIYWPPNRQEEAKEEARNEIRRLQGMSV